MLTADERDPIQSIKDLSSEMAQRALAEQYVVIPVEAITDTERIREAKFGVKDACLKEILPAAATLGLGGALAQSGSWPLAAKAVLLAGGLWWPITGAGHYLRLLNKYRNHYNYFVHKWVHLGRLLAHGAALGGLILAWPHLPIPAWAKLGMGAGSLIAQVPAGVWWARGKPPEESEYARLLRELLEEAASKPAPSLARLARAGVTHLGTGVRLYDAQTGQALTVESARRGAKVRPVTLTPRDRSVHGAIWATTGTGKTWTLRYLVHQDLAQGYSVAVVDPKGDQDLLGGLIEGLMITDRLQELVLIAPYWSEITDAFNPLAGFAKTEEVVGVVTTMLASQLSATGDARFFFSMAQRVSRDIAAVLLKTQGSLTLRDITTYAAYHRLGALIPQAKELGLEHVAQDLQELTGMGEAQYGKVAGNLVTGLHPVVAGEVAEVMLADRNPVADRLLAGQRVVLYVRSASLRDPQLATLLTLASIGVLKALAGVLLDKGGGLNPDLRLHIDEAYRALFPGVEDFLDKGRSVGLHTLFYFQDDSQLEKALDRVLREIIQANLGTYLWFQLRNEKSAKFAESMVPKVERVTPQLIYRSGQQAEARGSINRPQPVVQGQELLYLPDRHYVCSTKAGVWRGVMPLLPKPLLSVVPPGGSQDGTVSTRKAQELIKRGKACKVLLEEVMDHVRRLRGEEPRPVEIKSQPEPKPKPSPQPVPVQPAQEQKERVEKRQEETAEKAEDPLQALLEEARTLLGEDRMARLQSAAWWVRKHWDHPSFTHVWGEHKHVVYKHLAKIKLGDHLTRTGWKALEIYRREGGAILPAFLERLLVAALLHDAGKTTASKGSEHPREGVKVAASLGIEDQAILDAIAHHHQPYNKLAEPLDRLVAQADRAARDEEIRQLEEEGYRVMGLQEAVERWLDQHSLSALEELAEEYQPILEEKEGQRRPIWRDTENGLYWVDPDLVALPLSRELLDWDRENVVVAEAMFVDNVKYVLAETLRARGLLAPQIKPGYYSYFVKVPIQDDDPRLRRSQRVAMIGWLSQPGSSQKEEGED